MGEKEGLFLEESRKARLLWKSELRACAEESKQ
jgi:hypothetical protein